MEWSTEFTAIPNSIFLLTYSQPAPPCIDLHSCSLLEVIGVKGHVQFNKLQWTHSIHSQLTALPAIKETFERSDRVEKDKRSQNIFYQCKVTLFTLHKYSIVCFMCQSSDQRHPSGKLLIICMKRKKFRTSEITSASLLGIIEKTLVQQSPGLPDLFCAPPWVT